MIVCGGGDTWFLAAGPHSAAAKESASSRNDVLQIYFRNTREKRLSLFLLFLRALLCFLVLKREKNNKTLKARLTKALKTHSALQTEMSHYADLLGRGISEFSSADQFRESTNSVFV